MICANKTLSTLPNGQKLEVPDNFPYLGNHFVIVTVTWCKREGGPREATPINYRFARRSKGCFISDGAFEQRLTSLYYYVAGMSWPVRYSEVHM